MHYPTEIVAAARRYIGVRFAHQGRSAQGLDCLGLLICAAQDIGVTLDGKRPEAIDMPHYGARPDVQMLRAQLDAYLVPTPFAEACAGDVVLLKIDGSPQHLALISDYPMAGELGMIHAYAPARQVVEHRYDAHWRTQTYAVFRVPLVPQTL